MDDLAEKIIRHFSAKVFFCDIIPLMLDTQFIRQNLDEVVRKCADKGVIFDKERFAEIDGRRRKQLATIEELKSRKNKLAKEIGGLKKSGADSSALETETVALNGEIASRTGESEQAEREFQELLLNVPNLHHDSVPLGPDATANVVVREWGNKPAFDFEPAPHWELGEKNNGLDFARAGKISGTRFALYLGNLARLERALLRLMLETHTNEHGYLEVLPPFLVNDQSLIGTGNLPKFKDDLFKVENANLYLIPTAEVPLTNIHRDEVLDEAQLPIKYVAWTPCFRSEAGSHGKDIRGLVRQHQFNKVELLKFTTPESSVAEHEKLTADAEVILRKLDLPYRVVLLCSGDMSFSSAKTYDIEVWMPARNAYMEISSCSNFADFQARRARIKYRTGGGKKEFVHTLNGSALAAGRTVAAVLENFQTANGRVRIPAVLRPDFAGAEFL
jgi:seryl-tRNA synthetase